MAKKLLNRARGEARVTIAGTEYVVALTLAAMAAIEDGLGIDSLDQIEQALAKPSSTKLAVVVAALLTGGGNPVTVEDVRGWPITPADVGEMIRLAVGGAEPTPGAAAGN